MNVKIKTCDIVNETQGHDAKPLQSERVLSARVQEHTRALQHTRRRVRQVVDGGRRGAARLLVGQVAGEILRVVRPPLHRQDDNERGRRGAAQHTHRLSQAHRGDARRHAAAAHAQLVSAHRRGQGELHARHAQHVHGALPRSDQVRHQGLECGPRRQPQGKGEGLAHVQGQRFDQRRPQCRHWSRGQASFHAKVDSRCRC